MPEPKPNNGPAPMPQPPMAQQPQQQQPQPPAPPPAPKPLSENEMLARKYAPILRHHNQEPYLPMDPDEFFYKPENERSEDFFRSPRKTYKQKQARTVVNISQDKRLIQYWFYYAKNGCQGSRVMFRLTGPLNIGKLGLKERVLEICNLAIHEGDWENITIRLNDDKTKIDRIYLSAHGNGNWLPPEAMIMKDGRPFVYVALNSHALYAKDVPFVADTTITHEALDGVIGIEWFEIGDSITHGTALKNDSSGGEGPIEFDTQKALILWDDLKDQNVGKYNGNWGKQVDGRTVQSPPDISVGPIETILRVAVTAALKFAPQLKDKSTGNAPGSPWGRGDWKDFDCADCGNRKGIGRELLYGSTIGEAFDDYEKVKRQDKFKVREVRIAAGQRLTRICTKLDGAGDLCHGGAWDNEQTLQLADDEYISLVDAALYDKDGKKEVSGMKISTNKGRSIQAGTWTGEAVPLGVPGGTNLQIVGFHGRADGDGIHQIGILLGTRP